MQLLIISLLIATITNTSSSTSFAVGKYAGEHEYTNNLTLNKKLTIADAEELEVSIIGKTEKCCDFITIYADKKFKFSGVIEQKFIVSGSSIRVIFKSDGRTTDEGVLVKIATRLPASIFNDIKKQLLVSITKILQYGTNEIYVKINHNLQALKQLHTKLKTTQKNYSIINKIIRELIVISQNYQEIANMSNNIMYAHKQQFGIINNLKQQTLHNIDKIKYKYQNYQLLLNDAKNKLVELDDPLEIQRYKFSIDGYNAIMRTLTEQQQIWDRFYHAQEVIKDKLDAHSQKVKLLLHVLGINSQIYKQSANVALLRQNSVLKLNNLINLPELQNVINNLKISETDILKLLEKIKRAGL
ncbi:MAG TPA: hypothetical protein ENK59_02405 [Thioploca sp.]|nr:hypothetical protein [Thioploca sp.]